MGRQDERRMRMGLPFCQPVQDLFERLPREDKPSSVTFVAVTSDKGLCGGVNSAVNKLVRNSIVEEEGKGNVVKLQVVGGKGLAGLKRLYGDRFTHSFEEVAKIGWNMTTAFMIAERIRASKPSRLKVVSNQFKSMVAFDTVSRSCITLEQAQAMDMYSFEPSIYEVWEDLQDFYYGSVIYGSYLENATSEQSARMTAMDNASKNAAEMLDKLSLI